MSSRMIICWSATAVFTLCGFQASAAEPSSPGKLDWLRRPNGSEMARYYPEKGTRTETPGRGIIDCDVTAGGLLANCRVVEEWPIGYGFGDAALKLSHSFRIDPKTVDVNDPNLNRVVIPIVYSFPGKPSPPQGHLAGQNAVALSMGVKAGTRNAQSCPTKEIPDQLCVAHAMEWKEQPWLATTLPALEGVDMDSGTTLLQCRVSLQSRLTNCIAGGSPTPAAQKAMLAIAEMLTAPQKAMDGTTIGEGPVLVPFDWSKITPLARTLKRP
jgi:hypothetical protein